MTSALRLMGLELQTVLSLWEPTALVIVRRFDNLETAPIVACD